MDVGKTPLGRVWPLQGGGGCWWPGQVGAKGCGGRAGPNQCVTHFPEEEGRFSERLTNPAFNPTGKDPVLYLSPWISGPIKMATKSP